MAIDPDDRFADLNERISRLEQRAPRPDVVVRQRPPSPPPRALGPRELFVRRWFRRGVLAWCLLLWALMVLQEKGEMSIVTMVLTLALCITVGLGINVLYWDYWEFGRGLVSRILGRKRDAP